jgi:Na+-driven multidrug efflux pump
MTNNNQHLSELFRQKYLLERKREREILIVLKNFLRVVVLSCLFDVLSLILKRILFGSERFTQELVSSLTSTALGLCFLIIFIIFLCRWKFLLFQKKLDEIEQQIIKELSKT